MGRLWQKIKDHLEDWVYNSIKPIDVSCECNMILGIPDWETMNCMIDFAPTMMILSLILYPITFFMKKGDER